MTIELGDCRDIMRRWIAQGVRAQMCVTSPPYWGLRDYGTAECNHLQAGGIRQDVGRAQVNGFHGSAKDNDLAIKPYRDICAKCGARRIDRQLGLESTPEEYVANMVEVFRLVRDVLADDGTLWLNLGDSYAANGSNVAIIDAREDAKPRAERYKREGRSTGQHGGWESRASYAKGTAGNGLKPKDLIGMPWRVAFALQADGWYLRSDIIWSKPNPMPESVTDRPTKAHEYLFLLAKRERYFYDAVAIAEQAQRAGEVAGGCYADKRGDGLYVVANRYAAGQVPTTRNRRTVWEIATQPYSEAHFATFPEALVEPCILAGTSARGHCPACGKGWVRVIERSGGTIGRGWTDHKSDITSGMSQANFRVGSTRDVNGQPYTVTMRGWQPACACNLDPVPAIVLDPFMGSGTVARVATSLGRRYLGCELNPEYMALADVRSKVTMGLSL